MKTQREGWLDQEYVRIYADSDRARITAIYDLATFLPDFQPWGSWGLDALCLGRDFRLYVVDWIPLEGDFTKERYASVAAFEEDISRLHEATATYEHFQKEVHFVNPIAFGGDTSEAPVMIDQAAHAEVCRFWNATYRRLKGQISS
jgi:hypothetical protein